MDISPALGVYVGCRNYGSRGLWSEKGRVYVGCRKYSSRGLGFRV
jgi:hypothetical protein